MEVNEKHCYKPVQIHLTPTRFAELTALAAIDNTDILHHVHKAVNAYLDERKIENISTVAP